MSVTYQVNYLVKFSEYVFDISGNLYHCIIPFSDDVCDISGQLCQRLRRRKKRGGREKRKKGGNSDNYDVASRPSNGNRLQSCYLCLISHSGCDISQELYHFIIPFSDNTHDISNKPTGIVDCVQIIFSYFPLQLNIMFSFSNQSLEVSIETIKK